MIHVENHEHQQDDDDDGGEYDGGHVVAVSIHRC